MTYNFSFFDKKMQTNTVTFDFPIPNNYKHGIMSSNLFDVEPVPCYTRHTTFEAIGYGRNDYLKLINTIIGVIDTIDDNIVWEHSDDYRFTFVVKYLDNINSEDSTLHINMYYDVTRDIFKVEQNAFNNCSEMCSISANDLYDAIRKAVLGSHYEPESIEPPRRRMRYGPPPLLLKNIRTDLDKQQQEDVAKMFINNINRIASDNFCKITGAKLLFDYHKHSPRLLLDCITIIVKQLIVFINDEDYKVKQCAVIILHNLCRFEEYRNEFSKPDTLKTLINILLEIPCYVDSDVLYGPVKYEYQSFHMRFYACKALINLANTNAENLNIACAQYDGDVKGLLNNCIQVTRHGKLLDEMRTFRDLLV